MTSFFIDLKNLQAISKLLILFPIALIAGPAIVETIIFLSTIIFFFKADKKIIFNLLNEFAVRLFLIFWVYITTISFFSVEPLVSLKSSFFYIRFLFLTFCIYYALKNDKFFLKYFLLALGVCLVSLFFDSIFQYISADKVNIFGMRTPEPNDRISSLFHKEMIMGSYISRMLPFFAIMLFFVNKKLSYFVLSASLILVVLSGERTALGLSLIAIASILPISQIDLKNKVLIVFFFIFIFLTIVMSNQNYLNRNIILTKNEIFSKSNKLSDIKIFSPKHDSLYRTAYNIFLENKIYGAGPKSFRYICDKKVYKHNDNSCSTHPHNFPLQILSELGIIGFLIYLFIYGITIFRVFFSKDNILAKLMLVCFLINFFPFIPSGNLFNNWLSSVIYLPLGFYLYFNKEKNKI